MPVTGWLTPRARRYYQVLRETLTTVGPSWNVEQMRAIQVVARLIAPTVSGTYDAGLYVETRTAGSGGWRRVRVYWMSCQPPVAPAGAGFIEWKLLGLRPSAQHPFPRYYWDNVGKRWPPLNNKSMLVRWPYGSSMAHRRFVFGDPCLYSDLSAMATIGLTNYYAALGALQARYYY